MCIQGMGSSFEGQEWHSSPHAELINWHNLYPWTCPHSTTLQFISCTPQVTQGQNYMSPTLWSHALKNSHSVVASTQQIALGLPFISISSVSSILMAATISKERCGRRQCEHKLCASCNCNCTCFAPTRTQQFVDDKRNEETDNCFSEMLICSQASPVAPL